MLLACLALSQQLKSPPKDVRGSDLVGASYSSASSLGACGYHSPCLVFLRYFQWEKERKEEKRKREEAARDLGEIESRYAVVGLCKDQTRRRRDVVGEW